MDLLAYFRVLRRHWRLIVAVTVAGAALGVASTLLDRSSSTKQTYFRATHTLVIDNTTKADGAAPRQYGNPAQMAILATTGDVPSRVADKLGTTESGRELATRISTTVNADSDTLDITAIDTNAPRSGAAGRHVRRRAHRESQREGAGPRTRSRSVPSATR